MDTNGLSLYNVGTSLDLDALTQGGSQNNNNHHNDEDESDEGEEEEIQQRNAELRDLLTNAFDDLIEEDESDLETTNQHLSKHLPDKSQELDSDPSKYNSSKDLGYAGNSLYSPLHQQNGDLSETQYPGVDNPSINSSFNSWTLNNHKKNCVRFSPAEESKPNTYRPQQWNHMGNQEDTEKHYLSSGLNSKAEMDILYAARGTEIAKLTTELHQLHHKVALLEGEKTGMKMTLETSESILRESHEEIRRLKQEIEALNKKVSEMTETNHGLTSKLEAAENNTISLERQLLDLNLLQANHRDANRQDILLGGIKTRYENDLRTMRDELNRLRTEVDCKNESISLLERKLRDVTEMHERTLTERAANLQEFNRALDQQRILREQRDTLTSATLLDQLSRAQEEIDRLKKERISQNLSDSMAQLRLGNSRDNRDVKQTERVISSMEQRLQISEKTVKKLEETICQLQQEKEILSHDLSTLSKTASHSNENDRLNTELENVKQLYLAVCREKDDLEDHLEKINSGRSQLEVEKNQLLRDLEEMNRNMEENLNRHKAMVEANWDAKLQTVIQEQVARARLEWLKEKTTGQVDDLVHVEKSLGELQCLRESMDALRHERDVLQNELMKRQQQLKLERHLLREKFEVEKQMLAKTWQEKVTAASLAVSDKSESQPPDKALISATADAMARLRQQCEVEKLSIIAGYEKQILELQSNSSTPLTAQIGTSARSAQAAQDWRLELSKIKICLKNNQHATSDLLPSLDNAILKMETLWHHDQKVIQDQAEKYKHLKRRVRDYQKYVNDKLAKHKAERQRSEEYCRVVISDLLGRVTQELQLLEQDRCNVNQVTNVATAKTPSVVKAPSASKPPAASTPVQISGGLIPPSRSTFAQGIDDLQQQVNSYIRGLTNFNHANK